MDELCVGPQKPSLPPGSCTDGFEPNDRASDAHLLTPGVLTGLRVCAGDDDWFAVPLAVDDRVSVTVTPLNAAFGPALRLALHGADGMLLALTSGLQPDGGARIGSVRASLTGRYYLRIYAAAGVTDTIDYSLAVQTETRRCFAAETLDGVRAVAAPLLADGATDGVIPASGERFLRTELAAGETQTLTFTFPTEGGAFELGLYTLDGEVLRPLRPQTTRTPGRIELRYGPVSGAEVTRLRLLGPPAGAYRLVLQRSASRTIAAAVVRGVARYEDRPQTAAGLGEAVPRELPDAAVEVYRPGDDYVVGHGWTDAEGRFGVPYVNRGAPGLAVRVLARRDDGFVRTQVMRGELCRETYGITVPLGADDGEVVLLARAGDAGGAFNLHSELARVFDRLASLGYGPAAAPLDVFWERGVTQSCGSCASLGSLYIGGGAADPDEYDDAVILHELGHFYEETYSRTSTPGGHHDGSRTTPSLAWSEGFATFFSSAMRDSSLYLDTRDGDTFVMDLESPSRRTAVGVDGERMDGDVSEDLVSAALWDLRDAASPNEPAETIALGTGGTLRPTIDYFLSADNVERGAPGIDLVDYLDGVVCLGLTDRASLTALLAARRFPYDFGGPTTCTPPRRKPSAPLALTLDVTPRGPGDGLRLTARVHAKADADGLRVRWRLPAGWALRSGEAERFLANVVRGDTLELRADVVAVDARASELTESFSAHATLLGPGNRSRPVVRAWPEIEHRRAPLGRPALSADGHPLVLFGGSP